MSPLDNEPLLSLAQAAASLPFPTTTAALHHWARRGVRGVRLEVKRVGGRLFTSRAALRRFDAALDAIDERAAVPA